MKRFIAACLLFFGLLAPALAAEPAMALNPFGACGSDTSHSVCAEANNGNDSILGKNGILAKVINLLLTLGGIISVIVIIIGGIRYVTSGGDSNQLRSARDTILYAVVGLVIAVMAFAIVNFVLGKV